MSTYYAQYGHNGLADGSVDNPFTTNAQITTALASGHEVLVIKGTPTTLHPTATTTSIAFPVGGAQLRAADGTLTALTMARYLNSLGWTNVTGNVYSISITSNTRNCVVFKGSWDQSVGLKNAVPLQPLYHASGAYANVAATLASTPNTSFMDFNTKLLYVNVGGNPASEEMWASCNPGDLTTGNGAAGITFAGGPDVIENICMSGVGVVRNTDGDVGSVGHWAAGGKLGNLTITGCEFYHGTNHTMGFTEATAGTTANISVRVERMLPASAAGTTVFTGVNGCTVNLTLLCDHGMGTWKSNAGAVIPPGSGSALLLHAGTGNYTAFNVLDSVLPGGQMQVNDPVGPLEVKRSDLLHIAVGSNAPLTTGVTVSENSILRAGLQICANATDVVTIMDSTIYHVQQSTVKGVVSITGCTIDLSSTAIAGGRFFVTGGYGANLSLTFTDNHIIGAGATWASFLYQAKASNIVAWNRNKWTGFNVWFALEAFDSNNDNVSNGNFFNPEEPSASGDTAAECIQSLGYDLDNHVSRRSPQELRNRSLVPAVLWPMSDPAGRLVQEVIGGKYAFIGSGTATRSASGPSTLALATTFDGSTRYNYVSGGVIGNPSGNAWDFTLSMWVKRSALGSDGTYLLSQRNSSRTGDRLALIQGYSGFGQTANSLVLYVSDGTVRIGGSATDGKIVLANAWTHVTLVVRTTATDKSTPYWYADGLFAASGPEFNHPTAFGTWTDTCLGAFNTGSANWVGDMGPIAVWNQALTPSQIKYVASAFKDSGSPTFSGLGLDIFDLGLRKQRR
jgi:hypothetical protein